MKPMENQKRAQRMHGYGAIHLTREGDSMLVLIEVGQLWIPVIREHFDGPISHIVEPAGIEADIVRHFAKREPLFAFTNERHWINKARSYFAACAHTAEQAICIDALGRIVADGQGFHDAETGGAYPVKVYSLRKEGG